MFLSDFHSSVFRNISKLTEQSISYTMWSRHAVEIFESPFLCAPFWFCGIVKAFVKDVYDMILNPLKRIQMGCVIIAERCYFLCAIQLTFIIFTWQPEKCAHLGILWNNFCPYKNISHYRIYNIFNFVSLYAFHSFWIVFRILQDL